MTMMMTTIPDSLNRITTLALGGEMIPISIFVIGGLVLIVGILTDAVRKALHTREREQSRREIAAYIAEGSMSPDDGVRLMAAGERPEKKC